MPKLTARESQIVLLVVGGMSNKEMAYHLKMAEPTIKAHMSRMMLKCGVGNRTELAVMWLKSRKRAA